jgi:DNA mismatch repair protein MutS2
MGVTAVVTTHHRSIAAHAQASPSMANASVDLDPGSLLPTYHLTLGAPGRSYAMSVATHLGLPDDIMEEARSLLEPRHMLFEDWMKELQAERDELKGRLEEADRVRAQAEAARLEVEAARSEVEARLAELDRRREEALLEIDRELSEEFDSVRKQIRRAEASLSWQVSDETVRRAAAEVAEAKKVVQESLPDLQRRQPAPVRIRAGDVVEVKGLNVRGKVIAAPEDDEEAEVAIGGVRFKLDPQRLIPVEGEEEEPAPSQGVAYALGPMLTTAELDLRGMRVEEALFRVEDFLDKAVRDGMSSVRIVHGKGTGALRQAVRELLSGHPLARSHAPEAPERGGDGATTVSLL